MKNKKLRAALKWVLYSLLTFVLLCFQAAPQRLGIFSDVLFLLPISVAIACYEKVVPAAIAALFCGLFSDYSAQRIFGYHALLLCVICVLVSVIMKFYVRPIYLSVVVIVCASAAVYCLVDFFFFYLLPSYENVGIIFLTQYIPAFIKTAVFSLLAVFAVEKIYNINPNKASFDIE